MAVLASEQRTPVTIGCDVGQIRDSTAICVCEVMQVNTGKVRYASKQEAGRWDHRGHWIPPKGIDPVFRSEYTVRDIKRLPLGTSYPDVADHLAHLLCAERLARRDVRLLLDVTGVGRGVWDMLRQEIALRKEARHVQLRPVSFTHGETYNKRTGSLGKAYLVSRGQSLLQSGRVHAPDTPEVRATLEELKTYEIKIDTDGKDTYGAFAVGKHDDLATALLLATLEDPYTERESLSNRVY